MRTLSLVARFFLIIFVALLLELGSVITLSAIHDLEKNRNKTEVREIGALDCSLLSNRSPKPKVNIFQDKADEALGEQTLELFKRETAHRPEQLALLQKIYGTLEPHLPAYARTWKYRFYIADNPSINAYTLGGGIVVVNEGVFTESPSVDFIAHVVAHEIGHTALRHLTHRKSLESLLVRELKVLAGAVNAPPKDATREEMEVLFRTRLQEFLGYPGLSYELEAEADVFASDVIARAGYDLSVVAHYYQERAIVEKDGRGVADGSTHPPNKLRELILRCTEAKPVSRPYLETTLARVRGAIITRHSHERAGDAK